MNPRRGVSRTPTGDATTDAMFMAITSGSDREEVSQDKRERRGGKKPSATASQTEAGK